MDEKIEKYAKWAALAVGAGLVLWVIVKALTCD